MSLQNVREQNPLPLLSSEIPIRVIAPSYFVSKEFLSLLGEKHFFDIDEIDKRNLIIVLQLSW